MEFSCKTGLLRANRKILDDEMGRHKKNNLLVPALSVWGADTASVTA